MSIFSQPLTGKTVLVLLLSFFGVVVGVNMTMMKIAINTLPGTEVDSAYSASLAFTSEIKAARTQAERNWRVEAYLKRQSQGDATLTLAAKDAQGKPLRDVEFTGRLERPTDKRGDRRIVLAQAGEGKFIGTASAVSAGQWDLVIEGDADGRRIFLSRNRVVLN